MNNSYTKIKEIVSKVFGIAVEDISIKCRKTKYVNARCAFAHILFEKNILRNYSEIGRLIDRDHATVINSIRNHDDFMVTDPFYQDQYNKILKLVTKDVLNYENFNLMKMFKRIDIQAKCMPCVTI